MGQDIKKDRLEIVDANKIVEIATVLNALLRKIKK